jgi:hypothetical protein
METFGDIRIPISLGLVNGVTVDNFMGVNPDVDGDPEDLIFQGGSYTELPAADNLEISSSSLNDSITGTGARVIVLLGLDENGDQIAENILMNGTTTVTTTNTFSALNNAFVVDTGSQGFNDDNIEIVDQSTGNIMVGFIGVTNGEGNNRMHQFIYTIPNNITGILMQLTGSVSRGGGSSSIKEAETVLQIKPGGSNTYLPIGSVSSRSDGSSVNTSDLNPPGALTAGTVIKARAFSLSNNSKVTLTASLILIDNTIHGLT